MESAHIPPQEQSRAGSIIAVYLSLFLVVLAFFILLVTIVRRAGQVQCGHG